MNLDELFNSVSYSGVNRLPTDEHGLPLVSDDEDDFATVKAAAFEYPVIPIYSDYDPGEQRDDSGRWTKNPDGDPDPEYQSHIANIEKKIDEAFKAKKSTQDTETIDGNGIVYKPARRKLHDEIINEIWKDKNVDDIPNDGEAVIAGGLGGAGKSTVLKKHANIDQSKYLTINPDDIKEKMAAKGMIPKIEGLSPMETSPLVHEESSHIAQQLAHRAQAEKKNVIWDITMSSKNSVEKRIKALRDAGYKKLSAVFVDIPTETSVKRAMSRHKRGYDKYQKGEGYGGRYVPPSLIRKSVGLRSTKNREAFEDLKPQFDEYGEWDNSGKEPKQVGGTGRWKMDK